MRKISKRTVDSAAPKEKEYFVWDRELSGFGLRVLPSGRKTYCVQYRFGGQTRRYKIGMHGPITPDQARKMALSILARVAEGGDPAKEWREHRADITVAELCDRYLKTGCGTKKLSTISTDVGRIEGHIKPLLGSRLVNSVSKSDIERCMQDIAKGKSRKNTKTKIRGRSIVKGGRGTAARTVGLLGGIFTFAIEEGICQSNPVRGVQRYPDRRNERYLSEKEIEALGVLLKESEKNGENPTAIAALKLLLLTGCRKSEILKLEWLNVDASQCCLRLTDSKTGQKMVPLGLSAMDLLNSLPRVEGSPYVFPSMKSKGHFTGLQKVWERIRKGTCLNDVRIHDLRHTFASVGVRAGESLITIGKLLGHRDQRTTQLYAHVADDQILRAADRTSKIISSALGIDSCLHGHKTKLTER